MCLKKRISPHNSIVIYLSASLCLMAFSIDIDPWRLDPTLPLRFSTMTLSLPYAPFPTLHLFIYPYSTRPSPSLPLYRVPYPLLETLCKGFPVQEYAPSRGV